MKAMTTEGKNLKICSKGHKYYKTTNCPTCLVCEKERKPEDGFLSLLAAPARRALESIGIKTLHQLSQFSKKELLAIHGMGKSSIPILQKALKAKGLSFKIRRDK